MGRGSRNVPPITPSLEPPGAFPVTRSLGATNLTLGSVPASRGPSSLVSDGESDQETEYSSSPDDDLYYDAPGQHESPEPPSQLTPANEGHADIPTPNYSAGATPPETPVDARSVPSSCGSSRATFRGGVAAVATPRATSGPSPIADRAVKYSPTFAPTFNDEPQRPNKRAVVVGINYTSPTHPRNWRLRYAVKDAECIASSLKAWGFTDEAVLVLTDGKNRGEHEQATHGALMRSINWLVGGAKAGDLLVFFFSGHGCPLSSSLIMADGKQFGRDLLRDRLVLPVPAGCNLHIMLDCCSASSIIELQYCIGRMFPKSCITISSALPTVQPTLPSLPVSISQPPTQPAAGPSGHMAFAGALSGAAPVANTCSDPVPASSGQRLPVPGDKVGLYWGTPRCGTSAVSAPPPLISASSVPLTYSEVDQATVSPPVAPSQAMAAQGSSRGRRAPVRGSQTSDYFYERPGGFVKPAGTVTLWAGTGIHRLTFESYNGPDVRNGTRIKNGIVSNAICTALDACARSGLYVRELWHYIVGHVQKENDWRMDRDAAKPRDDRPNPFLREQCAELWLSQPEPLSAAGPALDRPMFSA